MLVKALINFNDYKEDVLRRTGDVFEVSEERYKEIIEKGGEWVKVLQTDEEQKEKAEKKQQRANKGKGKA